MLFSVKCLGCFLAKEWARLKLKDILSGWGRKLDPTWVVANGFWDATHMMGTRLLDFHPFQLAQEFVHP